MLPITDTELHHAAKVMSEKRIGCMPVVDGGQLAGILTGGDLLAVLTGSA